MLKKYDLVIADTLEELIETTNIAIEFGYQPTGGIQFIEEKFIQSIQLTNNKLKQKTMNETKFFQELSALMQDKQIVKITITKVGEDLTILINKDAKLINMSGTPEEIDGAFLSHMKISPVTETKELVVTVADAPEVEEEEEEEEPNQTEKEKKEEKKAGKAKVEKPTTVKRDKKEKVKKEEKTDKAHETELKETLTPEETPPPAAEEKKVDVEKAKANDFKFFMDAGESAMKERNYNGAVEAYTKAVEYAPDGNTTAKAELEKASKWKKAVDAL